MKRNSKSLLFLSALLLSLASCNPETVSGSTADSSAEQESSVSEEPISNAMFDTLAKGVSLSGTEIITESQSGEKAFYAYQYDITLTTEGYTFYSYEVSLKDGMDINEEASIDTISADAEAFERGELSEEINIVPSSTKKDENGNPYAVYATLGLDNAVHEKALSYIDDEGNTVHPLYEDTGFTSSFFSDFSITPLFEVEDPTGEGYYAYKVEDSDLAEEEKTPYALLYDAFAASMGKPSFTSFIFLTDGTKIVKLLAEDREEEDNYYLSYDYVFDVVSSGEETVANNAAPIEGDTIAELDEAYAKIGEGNFTEQDQCDMYFIDDEGAEHSAHLTKLTMQCTEESILYTPYIYSDADADYYLGIDSGYLIYEDGKMQQVTPLEKGYYLHAEKFTGSFSYPKLSSVFFTKTDDNTYKADFTQEKYQGLFLDKNLKYVFMALSGNGVEKVEIQLLSDGSFTATTYSSYQRIITTYTDIGSTEPSFTAETVNDNTDDLTWEDLLYSKQYDSLLSLLGSADNLSLLPTMGGDFSEVSYSSHYDSDDLKRFRLDYPLVTQSLTSQYCSGLIDRYQARLEADTNWTINTVYDAYKNAEDSYFLIKATYNDTITIGSNDYTYTLEAGYTHKLNSSTSYTFSLIGTLNLVTE